METGHRPEEVDASDALDSRVDGCQRIDQAGRDVIAIDVYRLMTRFPEAATTSSGATIAVAYPLG
jgi:hypothetical protein